MGGSYYRTGQAAKQLGVSSYHVRRLCEAGAIEAELSAGQQWKIPLHEVARLKKEGVPPVPAMAAEIEESSADEADEAEDVLPSGRVIEAAEEVRITASKLAKRRLEREAEEVEDWSRERQQRQAMDRAVERQRVEAAQREQRRQRWAQEWTAYALDSLVPSGTPHEVELDEFKQAGVDKVEFRDGTKLTSKQVAEIEAKTPTGVAKLNFVSESFRGTNIGGFGGTDAHATSAVSLKSIFEGSFLNGLATDDSTRNFRVGEVASHELGHAVGFDSNAYVNFLSAGAADYFRSNLMDEHQGVPTKAKSFDTGSDRNKRIIQEINRIGDNTPKR